MKISISLLLLLVLLTSTVLAQEKKIDKQVLDDLEDNNMVKVVIKVKEDKKFNPFKDNAKKVEDQLNEKPLDNYKNLIVVEVKKDEITRLEKLKEIERIEPAPSFSISLQNSAGIINASEVWPMQINNTNLTGIDETVCVLDTGVDFSHPALIGKNLTCIIDCFDNSGCVENCSRSDDHGHGTHVAGTIAASSGIQGISQGANIMGVKVLNENGDSSSQGVTDLTRAIDWCVLNRNTYNISAISMSLGTVALYDAHCDSTFSSTWTASIDNATFHNISVIASTGNSGSGIPRNTTHIASPACIANTTAVSATDKDDSISSYGHYNSITDLFAPGSNINSTHLSNSYLTQSGTSMATPHVSAAMIIVRQFYKAQSGLIYTPSQIQTALINNGLNLTASGLNFTRINIFNAIISLDTQTPEVALISPANNHINLTTNHTFNCNATDVALKNVTFSLWNSSSGIVNQTETNASSVFNQFQINITNLAEKTYHWNCLYSDMNNNKASAPNNFSITVGGISMSLISPTDKNFTNNNNTEFSCFSSSSTNSALTNSTFYLWNSTSLLSSETKLITGTTNTTLFQYNFTTSDSYSWNCLALNNNTNSSLAPNNYSITYDTTFPNITLISPSNNHGATGTTTLNFQFNVSDNLNLTTCDLVLDSTTVAKNSSEISNSTNTISHSVSVGTYTWSINCTDQAFNQGNSSTRTLTINATASSSADDDSSSGGSSGSSGSSTAVQVTTSNSESSNEETAKENDEIPKLSPTPPIEESTIAPITGSAVDDSQEKKSDDMLFYGIIGIVIFLFGFMIYAIFNYLRVHRMKTEEINRIST